MPGIFSPAELSREVSRLGSGECFADPRDLLADALSRFRPPEKISTLDWAEKNRKFRLPDSGAMVPYDRWRTPYNIAPSNALDEPGVELVVMVKPSRSGGTTIAENFLGKMIDIGPMGRVAWYLGSDKAVKEYVEGAIRPLFEDHHRLQAKVGTGRSDDTDTRKRVNGYLLEFLAANKAAFTNREFYFGVMDEPDAWAHFSETPKIQLQGRQKNVGRRRKGMILSHPDKGWGSGVAPAWVTTSRGIYVMRCASCAMFAAAHATRFWPEVQEFRLDYAKVRHAERAGIDERVDLAARTAGMACPHCGEILPDEQRFAMVDEAGAEGWWMHRGQTLDPVHGIKGEMEPNPERGFYVHGLMVKTSPAADLAKSLEEALAKYERSRGSRAATKTLREFMSKQLAEIFEGKKDIEGVSAAGLQKRAKAEVVDEEVVTVGLFPAQAEFITAAVDVGVAKFDVSFRAWDRENRSWWLDRLTIRQRLWDDDRFRDIRTRERIEDWDVLIAQVIERRFPIIGRDGWEMPVALTVIDVSDGNVTWIGREFAARCYRAGLTWKGWPKVQLVQGSPSAKAAELPPKPRLQDDKGKRFPAGVLEWSPGVHKLKELALERLAITDGGPGQCFFANGIAANHFEEYFNEPLIDGKFDRQGPNESLDLFAYEEAARLMLKPDKKDIDWVTRRPPWAQAIEFQPKGGDPSGSGTEAAAPPPKPETIFERHKRMTRRTQPNGRS